MTRLRAWYKVITPREDLREGRPRTFSWRIITGGG